MIPVTFKSNPAWLIDDIPDWQVSPELTVHLPSQSEQGLIGIETRRLTGDTMRLSLAISCFVTGHTAVTNARNSLQAMTTEPVLCPLWPAWFQAGVTPPVTAPYYVEIGDGATPTIVPASALPLSRPACPLMIGRLTDWPELDFLTDDSATVDYSFTENDASFLTPPTYIPPSGLLALGNATPLFPFRADWADEPVSDGGEKTIDRQNIGQSRVTADTYYLQIARRKAIQNFTLYNGNDTWNLLAFFTQIGVGNFWLPVSLSEANLTANVLSTDNTLTVDNPANIGTNVFLTLDDLNNRAMAQVTGTTGSKWNLAAAVGTGFLSGQTRLESTVLARFGADNIKLTFTDVGYCTAELHFKEVPYEALGETGETIGTTFGGLPTTAYLYKFQVAFPGGTNTIYLTNFERDLTYGGNTYVSNLWFEHEAIHETDNLERQNTTISSRNNASNPLTFLAPFALEYPLMVTIMEVSIASGGTAATLLTTWFYGEVIELQTDGPFLKATAESNSAIFDRQVPNRLFQNGCNWILFSSKCTLSASAWTWTGVTTAWDGFQTLTVGTVTSSNGASLVANFFAGGMIQVNSGALTQARFITTSSAEAGGAVTLTLSQPLIGTIANGTAIAMYPGCDGRKETCVNVFNNFINFGGFPFMPLTNPTLTQTQSINAGKKS